MEILIHAMAFLGSDERGAFTTFAAVKLLYMKLYFIGFKGLAMLMCCLAAWSCGGEEETQAGQGRDSATATVKRSEITVYQNYSATIQGCQDIDIYPQVSGTITKVCVTEGQKIRKGETLFIIDQVPYRAQLQMAEANVEAAQAAVATAQLVAKSKQQLYDKKVVSEFELLTANSSLATAKAALAQAEAARVNAENNYSYTMVKSPLNGVVGTIPFRVGSLVSPQIQQPLTTVSDNSTMYVYFSVGENALLGMVGGNSSIDELIKNMPPLVLLLNNGEEYPDKGRLESVSGVINRSTGSVSMRAAFPNKNRILISGSSGNISIPNVYKDAMVIPKKATVEIQDKIYVYKVEDNTAKQTLIEVAANSTSDSYIVTAGLEAGCEIVVDGVAFIHDGDRVGGSGTNEVR